MMGRSLVFCLLLTAALVLVPHREQWSPLPEKGFFMAFPETNLTAGSLSTYDTLFRQYADSIGWDWRLVAAVVYHESRFNNGARSGKGAIGLMQIRSSRYSEAELLDPARNLEVGTRYLHKLEGLFPAATPLEGVKYALAAFNLGDGRVRTLVASALSAGADVGYWDNVAAFLPQGHHTVSYVEKVLDTYADYCAEYPR